MRNPQFLSKTPQTLELCISKLTFSKIALKKFRFIGPLNCLHNTTLILLSIFLLIETIRLKI